MINYECPACGMKYDRDPMQLARNPLMRHCRDCGGLLARIKTRRHKTDAQRRSRDQERRASIEYDMRQQAASGATPHYKSDLRKRAARRGENKETTARSFTLKLDELLKLEKEAAADELPLFLIEFQCVHPFRRYEVLPAGTLGALIHENQELKRRLSGDTDNSRSGQGEPSRDQPGHAGNLNRQRPVPIPKMARRGQPDC